VDNPPWTAWFILIRAERFEALNPCSGLTRRE
jgi:hypothetical protein